MGPAGGVPGAKPDGSSSRDGGVVPGIFAGTMGAGLPPWPRALGGNPATGLHRLLHAARRVALAVAPAEARIGSSESHPTADITGPGSEPAIGATDFTTGSRSAAEQTAAGFDRPASRDRRCSERAVPGLCGNAEADFWLSRHPAPRQGNNLAWMVGGSAEDRNPRAGALCPNRKAGPQGGGIKIGRASCR